VTPAPDFTLSATPATRTISVGAGTNYTASVAPLNGFAGSVTLDVSGLPAGTSANFSPGSIVISGSSTLTLATSGATPPGTYPLTITGTSGSLVHHASVSLTVNPPPDFTVSVSPSNQSVRRGATATYLVTITPTGGFTGSVILTMTSNPQGLSGTFSPVSAGQSTLTVSTNATGTFTLTITGTSGSLTHSTAVGLTVTKH
jgi:hypothetical protein